MQPIVETAFTAEMEKIALSEAAIRRAIEARAALLDTLGEDSPARLALNRRTGSQLSAIARALSPPPASAVGARAIAAADKNTPPLVRQIRATGATSSVHYRSVLGKVLDKKASAYPALEKTAAIWGAALSRSYDSPCGPDGKPRRWSDRFTDTPFYDKALAIEKADAEDEVSYAHQQVEDANRQVKEAQFRARVAGLEVKLLTWKAKSGGEKEKVALQEKLACCSPCGLQDAWPWATNFKGSPYYKEAVQLEVEDAQMSVSRREQDIKRSERWRKQDERGLDRTKLEAEWAAWKAKQITG